MRGDRKAYRGGTGFPVSNSLPNVKKPLIPKNGGTGTHTARKNKKKTRTNLAIGFGFRCGKRDLNPYGNSHTPLKRARLPVPPLPHGFRRRFLCEGVSPADG